MILVPPIMNAQLGPMQRDSGLTASGCDAMGISRGTRWKCFSIVAVTAAPYQSHVL